MRNITKNALAAGLMVGAFFAAPAAAQARIGEAPPEFVPVKWYNSPSMTLEELKGKAVYIDVFRTW